MKAIPCSDSRTPSQIYLDLASQLFGGEQEDSDDDRKLRKVITFLPKSTASKTSNEYSTDHP